MPSPLVIQHVKWGFRPELEATDGEQEFTNDASKEECGAQGVTVVGPTKGELRCHSKSHIDPTSPKSSNRVTDSIVG